VPTVTKNRLLYERLSVAAWHASLTNDTLFTVTRSRLVTRRASFMLDCLVVSAAVASAQASLSGSLMVDNSFRAYISTSAKLPGQQISSGNNC